ncbi:MAG: NADH-quinone oxidoreductase subunit C [Actinomycetota bacterium]
MTGEQVSEGADGAELASEEPRLLPADPILHDLVATFPSAAWSTRHGEEVVELPRQDLRPFAEAARDAGFEMLADVTAVDWLDRHPRFDLAVNLLSMRHHRRLRLMVEVPADDPRVDSLVPVWPGANYAEREVYDMFGIEFDGHPDLTRILMPDDWEGYPLRKDFAVGTVPVQFKGAHRVS